MSATPMPLEDWLQELVDQQVLTSLKASNLQSEFLMTPEGELRVLPKHLKSSAERVYLYEMAVSAPMQ